MTEPRPPGLLLLSQPEQLRIAPAQMVEALAEPWRGLHHPEVEFDLSEVAREALLTQDWSTAQRTLEERFQREFTPLRDKYPDYCIVYFGSAPIPLALLLGFLLETWQRVLVIPHHHAERRWAWVDAPDAPPARLLPASLPSERDRTPGEVIIRVSTSHRVDALATRAVVPDALFEFDLGLENPSEDAFTSQAQMEAVARAFRDLLDDLGNRFQGVHRIHLFASVQPGMALLLGAQISKTMHPPVRTYQYARHAQGGPYHVPAVEVNRAPAPEPVPLKPEQQVVAAQDRQRLAEDLAWMKALAENWKPPSKDSWLEGLFKSQKKCVESFSAWPLLPTLYGTPLFKTTVDVKTQRVEDSFRLAPPHNVWQIDDQWLARLASRLPDETARRSSLRMLVLHELAHRGHQSLTRTSSQEIGRFPKVLEEIDFQADVWAMLHEYALSRSQTQIEDAPQFFLGLVHRATECMWAFDEGPPLREIQIRRLNRYLIWYWMFLSLERLSALSHGGTLDAVLSELSRRPILELAGSPIHTHDGRVFFDLDPRRVKTPELAIYHDGRLFRHGSRPDFAIDALLDGVRMRDGEKILRSLRGAFEQTVR